MTLKEQVKYLRDFSKFMKASGFNNSMVLYYGDAILENGERRSLYIGDGIYMDKDADTNQLKKIMTADEVIKVLEGIV